MITKLIEGGGVSVQAVLGEADARIDIGAAERAAGDLFGVEGRASRLAGERDQNFMLATATGERFVLKFSHSAEGPEVADFQTRALEHLARAADAPTPRLRPGRDGKAGQTWRGEDGEPCSVRLLTFLPGQPLSEVAADARLLRAVGAALARFDRALQDFSHPADSHELLWDLSRAAQTRAFAPAIKTITARRCAEQGLDLFERVAAPALPHLRAQVLHNDLNPHNVLVRAEAGEVTGLLDLGDAVRGPLVNDVAVAAAYHVRSDGDALGGPAALVRGYVGVLPLLPEEVAVLPALIAGRLAMTLAITAWRAERHPENRTYILRNAPAALTGLSRLLDAPAGAVESRLREAAGLAP